MEDLSRLQIDRAAAPQRRGSRRLSVRTVIAAVLALIAAVLAGLHAYAPVSVETIAVASAYPSQGYTVLNATGYVVPQRKAAVASKATGRLEWLGVREGSQVKAGEVLARLESRDVAATREQAAASVAVAQANLEQGRAELNEAERNYNRSRELLAKNFVSQAAHDGAVSRYEKARAALAGYRAAVAVAQANLRAAEVGVEQTLIRAPFDGVVLTKNANVGDVITPFSSATGSQAAVVTIADMSTLEVEADVAEANLGKVSLQQPCEIQLDALPDVRFEGKLRQLVPTVDRAKATVSAKVAFDTTDPRILPEMSAKVAFLSRAVGADERAPRLALPATAVVRRGDGTVVYRVEDGRAHEVAVTPGAALGDLVEISGAVKAGDKVVARPPDGLRDGTRVSMPSK